MSKPTLEERFWSKVDIRGKDECWEWRGGRFKLKHDYGAFHYCGNATQAHRVAFFLSNGFWPEECRHKCDNPPCCNPSHLLDGTHQDNVNDMVERGRGRGPGFKGDNHPMAKLTNRQVSLVRSLKGVAPSKAVAKLFKISSGHVRSIQLKEHSPCLDSTSATRSVSPSKG
jgi:hypothetical protein